MGKKVVQHRCKYCGYQAAKSKSRGLTHLNQCQEFKLHQKDKEKNEGKKMTQIPINIVFRSMPQAHLDQVHRANAMAVYDKYFFQPLRKFVCS